MDLIDMLQDIVESLDVTENTEENYTISKEVEEEIMSYLKNGGAINCTTEEQATELLHICDKNNIIWNSFRSTTSAPSRWKEYEKKTCYCLDLHNRLKFAPREYYRDKERGIRRFKDFEQPYNEKCILEDLSNKLVYLHALDCKKSSHHCIYSNKIYSESCLKCFVLWLLKTVRKQE